MGTYYESGWKGAGESLAGIPNKGDRGREIVNKNVTVTAAVASQILSANSRRIAALIQSYLSNADIVYLTFGSDSLYALYLYPGQSFQIDQDFPWTGEMWASVNGADKVLCIEEISVA